MQSYLFDRTHETESIEFEAYHSLISKLKHRFQTYGYSQVRTSTFERYDLYHSVSGTVNRRNMVKVIDQSGDVLVMRPDVTIPITRMAALSNMTESRLFYVLNVFRQGQGASQLKERLQAGVERFGHGGADTDADVIALAIHALRDLEFEHFKIEIGHAGFFKDIIEQLNLTPNEKEQLQTLIQSKNLADIQPFLAERNIPEDVTDILQAIPLLYGNPESVLQHIERLPLTAAMQEKVTYLRTLHTLLQMYDVTDAVVFDLGLINNMDYYSDVIFQGFVAGYGQPVVMGGRYDQLADQFGTSLPAIGFAYEVSSLLNALKQENRQNVTKDARTDIALIYHKHEQSDALKSATCLRNAGYSVITSAEEKETNSRETAKTKAYFNPSAYQFDDNHKLQSFTDTSDLLNLLNTATGDD